MIFRLPSPTVPAATVSDLRTAVSGLGFQASLAVDAVRRAFTAGAAPVQTAGSGSAADYINRFGGTGVPGEIVTSTSHLGLSTAVGGTTVTPPKPELDQVEVRSSRRVGVLDSYYTRIVLSIAVADLDSVSSLRVMRADGDVLDVPPPGLAALEQIPLGSTRKSQDPIGGPAIRSSAVGLGSKLSLFIRDDTFTSARSVISSASLRPVPPPVNTNRMVSAAGLLSIDNADPSVLKSVPFFITQRSMTSPTSPVVPLTVGKRQGINVLGGSSVSVSSHSSVQVGNSQGFREVFRVPPVPNVRVGDFVEIELVDRSVVYGRTYTYYAVCQSSTGLDGPRSRMVRTDIVRRTPPAPPKVFFGVVANHPRFSVRATGTFVDHVEVFRRGAAAPEFVRLLGSNRAMVTDVSPDSTDSGFIHVGDLAAGADRSITFVDKGVVPGQSLDYRFYTVDAYGVKCQTPFSCSVFLPDHGRRIPLGLPTITAEQGTNPRTINVTVSCDDPRVLSFKVSRRETGNSEKGFHIPTQPDSFRLGTVDPKRARSRISPIIQYSQKAWSGIFVQAVSGSGRLVDSSVGIDRSYQYSVIGVDVRGNETSPVISQVVGVSTKPVADPPVALTGTVVLDSAGFPMSVLLEWSHGTSDFSPNDLIGDQDVLFATSARTVFQVERRKIGRPNWEFLPATTGTSFSDLVSSAVAPNFRPPYASVGSEYEYRVIAMQSGGFLSPHTDPVGIVVVPPPSPPSMVWSRSTPLAVRPAHVVISWNYDGIFVDGWEIDRAPVNKIFGSKVVSMDSAEARSLPYARVAEVKRESSRATGLALEDQILDPTIFVGNRFFIDQDISLTNSYFYRVRAVDVAGRRSDWAYAGIFLTDSPHDRKFYSTLSDSEKVLLTSDPRPISTWRNR